MEKEGVMIYLKVLPWNLSGGDSGKP